jgi:hypothetical protein
MNVSSSLVVDLLASTRTLLLARAVCTDSLLLAA